MNQNIMNRPSTDRKYPRGVKTFVATVITIIIGLVVFAIAGCFPAKADEPAARWIGFAQDVDAAKQATIAIYPGYAPDLKVDGVKKQWGAGIALLYPLARIETLADNAVLRHTFTGLRLDYMADKFYAPSVTVGFRADVQLFGVTVSPFVLGGVIAPLGDAGNREGDVGAIFGGGVSAGLLNFGKANEAGIKPGSLSVFYAVEKWTLFDGVIHRPGAAITYRF